ncbi:MAG: L-2,4-diaminobutyrate decarboxylase [Actinomycetota bacterium]|jgi:glutamate/tyrosine decarboxylase-like PLP-dependent enzyme|nr:L-2,4-diaminobutyrate decarboxylase [Actinomycetota bacterium]
MHRYDEELEQLGREVLDYALNRLRLDPVPLDKPRTPDELAAAVGRTITEDGLGGHRALDLFARELATSCISIDHPRYLSFIPAAPTEASSLFDLVVGASSIYGGSWLEGSGAVYAENDALRWIAELAGLPEEAGGVFVQGGTTGNLSALVAARHTARARLDGARPPRWRVAVTSGTHSSVAASADVMDVDLLRVPVGEDGRFTGADLRGALDRDGEGVFAVAATAGDTNFGTVDDLASLAEVCQERGIWLHVDAAYGGAGLAAPSVRHLFAGVEHADSFLVDPHKWLFAPFDSCALLYRDPNLARAAHTQKAAYLDVLTEGSDWNPSDFSIGLTRRARGLPFWFSLATHGTRAYSEAVERTVEVARFAAAEINRRSYVELLREPDLSIVVFRRVGWTSDQYSLWSDRLLQANFAFVVPTGHQGETVARFAIVNPRTTESDIAGILDTMA